MKYLLLLISSTAMADVHVDYYHDKIVIEDTSKNSKFVYVLSEDDKKIKEDDLVKKVLNEYRKK